MLSFSEVINRALNGPICTERDFDLGIFVPNLRKVLSKYNIKFDPTTPIPADDDFADSVWQAAMEFLLFRDGAAEPYQKLLHLWVTVR